MFTGFNLMLSRLSSRLLSAALLSLVSTGYVQAADMLSFGGFSYHFERDLGHNEVNYGLGFERDVDQSWSWSAGVYKNSLRRASVYALANYYPWALSESWRAGVMGGLMTGYHQSPVIPVAAPILEWRGTRWSFQGYVVPTIKPYVDGAFVIQVKYILGD